MEKILGSKLQPEEISSPRAAWDRSRELGRGTATSPLLPRLWYRWLSHTSSCPSPPVLLSTNPAPCCPPPPRAAHRCQTAAGDTGTGERPVPAAVAVATYPLKDIPKTPKSSPNPCNLLNTQHRRFPSARSLYKGRNVRGRGRSGRPRALWAAAGCYLGWEIISRRRENKL